jgi:hypothetical protein
MTMERYAHVTAAQQREAAELLQRAVAGQGSESVTESVTDPVGRVAQSRPESPRDAHSVRESGSGGRIRTYDQAVNSRPLYH